MRERLVFLGTKGGPAIRPLPGGGSGPGPTATLLEIAGRSCVVDCGLGVARGLVNAGMRLGELDIIFITHLHSDHVLELGPLIHTAWTAGLKSPVTVFGPSGTRAYWQGFLASMQFDIDLRIDDEGRPDLRDLVEIREYAEGEVMDEGGLKVCALRVEHPPVAECYALKFEAAGRKVVFSSDTRAFRPLAQFAAGADILIHEAMLEAGVDALVARTGNGARLKEHLLASHSLAGEAASIATEADVGRLVLHHLIPADDPDFGELDWIDAVRPVWAGPLTIAHDGLELAIPSPEDHDTGKETRDELATR